jgi:hypothetical protein
MEHWMSGAYPELGRPESPSCDFPSVVYERRKQKKVSTSLPDDIPRIIRSASPPELGRSESPSCDFPSVVYERRKQKKVSTSLPDDIPRIIRSESPPSDFPTIIKTKSKPRFGYI